jgi:hypothetical protein
MSVLRNVEEKFGATKQGYLWIADRSFKGDQEAESWLGESEDVVLKLSQARVAVGRREQ